MCKSIDGGFPSSCGANLKRIDDLGRLKAYLPICESLCSSDYFCVGYQYTVWNSAKVNCYLFKQGNKCPRGFIGINRDNTVVNSHQLTPGRFTDRIKYSVCNGKKTGNVHRLRILVFYIQRSIKLIDFGTI